MATLTDDAMTHCAACGKGGEGLKKCTACELVRYCGVDCQRAHRPQHKRSCKRRAAELHDEALFRLPPSREECPICFLELPIMTNLQKYNTCCGKILCYGCSIASAEQSDESLCPFCRKPAARSIEERRKRIDRRIELNDPEAIFLFGMYYFEGGVGVEQDIGKAVELSHRAAELGSIVAHSKVGGLYWRGDGVQVDKKKAMYHFEIAAMGGHLLARHNLGVLEWNSGNDDRAMKHYMISASAGHDKSLKGVQNGYSDGIVNKDDFEKTLRAHQKSKNEMKSEWRDHAAAVG